MSRFLVVPAPVFSPTRCVSCSSNRDGQGFVDLMVDGEAVHGYDEKGDPIVREGTENFGHLYLCATCVGQVAAALGWVSPEEGTRLRNREIELDGELLEAQAALETARSPEGKLVSVGELVEYLRQPQETRA